MTTKYLISKTLKWDFGKDFLNQLSEDFCMKWVLQIGCQITTYVLDIINRKWSKKKNGIRLSVVIQRAK